ncbi:MAG: hypothetical protein U9Q85_02395 [Patescibacteria group bacterium]|nr:hypothetical protein [Patescibacteria group bacterium]
MKIILQIILVVFIISFLSVAVDAADLGNASEFMQNAGKAAGYKDQTSVTLNTTVGLIINTALSLLGVIFLGLMIYGGFLWMTDRGNENQMKRAQKLITAAVIGIIIVLAAYAISFFVISKIQGGTMEPKSETENENNSIMTT